MIGRSVDAGNVYSSARDAARLAVTEGENFGLTDVATEDQWVSIIATGAGVLAVAGSLHGVIDALRVIGATTADVLSQDGSTGGAPLDPFAVALARGWVANAIGLDLDEEGAQRLVSAELVDRGWLMETGAIAQLVLSVVLVGAHAAEKVTDRRR